MVRAMVGLDGVSAMDGVNEADAVVTTVSVPRTVPLELRISTLQESPTARYITVVVLPIAVFPVSAIPSVFKIRY
jgi:hypothetical protein